jgi:hypothetical protein
MKILFYRSILVWWSRRNDKSQGDCDLQFENENPSLEGKICGKIIFIKIDYVLFLKILIRLLLCKMSTTICCMSLSTNESSSRWFN